MRPLIPARVHLGPVALLAVLTLSACLLVGGLPRALQASFDEALHAALRGAPASQTDLLAQMEAAPGGNGLRDPAQFAANDARLRALLPAPLRPLVLPPGQGTSHMSAETYDTPVHGSGGMRYLNLGWLSDADRRVHWTEGRPPGAPASMTYERQTIPMFEVGVSEDARARMGLKIGTTQILGESDYAAVKVVGVFAAVNPADRYWTHHSDTVRVVETQPPGKLEMERRATALIPAAGLTRLDGNDRNLVYTWVLGLDPDRPTSLDATGVEEAVAGYARAVTVEPATSAGRYRLATGLAGLLDRFLAAQGTARTVTVLVLGGLLAVAAGVIVLAVRLLSERADTALALARARGASLWRLAAAGAGPVAIAAVPAAVAGYALSWLVPGPPTLVVHAGPALVLAVALGFAAARPVVAHRTPLRERRDDVAAARPPLRRTTLEALVVVLALAGAYLLRSRSLAGDAGDDPFLLVVPVALTVAAALVTIRCYPYPLRLLVRFASRGRAAVPYLGLIRAARARPASVLPVLILLPALAVSVFAAVISSGVEMAQRQAAWQATGAPIKVTSRVELPAGAVDRVKAVPGVELVVPAQTGQVQLGYTGERAEAIAVDVAAWRRVLEDSPIPLPALSETASGVPALVSPELRGRGTIDIGWQARTKVTERGVVTAVPGFFTRGKFLVVPLRVNARPSVNTLLVKGDADLAAVARAVGQPLAAVTSQAAELATIRDAPLTGTVQTVLWITTLALAGYALVAVVVMLVIGAADRARALAFLRPLGLSERQARGLTVLEILPLVLVTALAGLGLGLALPAALGPGIDLSSYAGGVAVEGYAPDLAVPLLLAAGLAVVAGLGAYVHTAAGRRRGSGTLLRAGDLT
ncbi:MULTISPECIES: FtsX-like permease family protein [unclassified Nonomuraea]|uniref:FtsX-like permease family protein n=1 Tax=unclassified Nonomuraea TaxID=2593643 RepID=UPI00340E9DEA